uniref:Protein BTG1 n=1 Tax=Suricata suricatta TaxID=37032 RepID=A0A673TEC3_SURSU
MDPLIGQAAQRIGLSSQELFRLLPSELTLWVDPYEVSYRIGEDGSICVLYEASPAGAPPHPCLPSSCCLVGTWTCFRCSGNHIYTFHTYASRRERCGHRLSHELQSCPFSASCFHYSAT